MVNQELNRQVTSILSTMWNGTCTVYCYIHTRDEVTKEVKLSRIMTLLDEPCRLSYGSAKPAVISDSVTTIEQEPTLFLSPEAEIPVGSDITVKQNGRVMNFKSSGEPRVYTTHQEIAVTLMRNIA